MAKKKPKARRTGLLWRLRRHLGADPGKLAAWISASHVEKAPKKKDPTPRKSDFSYQDCEW